MAWLRGVRRAGDARTIPFHDARRAAAPQSVSGPRVDPAHVRREFPQAIGTFASGLAEGLWTFFYPDGGKDCEGRFGQGKRQGLWVYWRPQGSLDCLGEYRDDLEDGWWTSFLPDGAIEEQGRYHQGRKVGLWTYGAADGRLETRIETGAE